MRRYTKPEVNILKALYSVERFPVDEIAETLERTPRAIQIAVSRLGFARPTQSCICHKCEGRFDSYNYLEKIEGKWTLVKEHNICEDCLID